MVNAYGQFGVAVSSSVEKVAALGQLLLEAGGVLLLFHGRRSVLRSSWPHASTFGFMEDDLFFVQAGHMRLR
jgi:hypothetical protein